MKLRRILCIDGARVLRDDYLVGLVDVGGYTTRFCWTHEQAFKNAPDMRPDLILLAESVGDISTDKLLVELEKIDAVARTPILLVCSQKEVFERHHRDHPSVVGWLRRPFDPMDLADLIGKAWESIAESEYFS